MSKHSKITSSRIGRLGMLGKLAGGIAGGVISEGARQLSQGKRPVASELLMSPGNMQRIGDRLSEMRGAAMKVGQLISMDSGSLIPPELAEILAGLRNKAHFMPLGDVARILGETWGEGWEQRFKRFNFTPIAAASIGQVHQAELKDGRQLAIKIQYPGIARSIDSDVDNVASLLRFARLVPAEMNIQPMLDEAKQQLHLEADYRQEASFLKDFKARAEQDRRFKIPQVIDELSSEQVLVMEFLNGHPLEELATQPMAVRQQVANEMLDLALMEVFDWKIVQTDPNFANYLYDPEQQQIQLLDFGATRQYSSERIDALYQLLIICMQTGSDEDILQQAKRLGYVEDDDAAHYKESIVALLRLATEPARSEEPYNFTGNALPARMREIVIEMRLKQKFGRIPPVEILLLHRKLGGLYLLFNRLQVKLPVKQIIESRVQGSHA